MKVKNKQKAITLCNEYLEVLNNRYNRDSKSYLYMYTWVDMCGISTILENLTDKNDFYNPRTDWAKLIKQTDDVIKCTYIDESIKDDAQSILNDDYLMYIWYKIKFECFQ